MLRSSLIRYLLPIVFLPSPDVFCCFAYRISGRCKFLGFDRLTLVYLFSPYSITDLSLLFSSLFMVKDISVLVCSQSCRSDSILQKSDAFTSNRLSRNIKAVIAISRSFALQKNSRIYEFFYSQRLLRHDFNNFCSM